MGEKTKNKEDKENLASFLHRYCEEPKWHYFVFLCCIWSIALGIELHDATPLYSLVNDLSIKKGIVTKKEGVTLSP